jgi:hypothetical protein
VISARPSASPVDPPIRAAQIAPATTSAAADPKLRTRARGATSPTYRGCLGAARYATHKLQATIVVSYRADSFGEAGDAPDDVLDVRVSATTLKSTASKSVLRRAAGRSAFRTTRGRRPRPRECRTRWQASAVTALSVCATRDVGTHAAGGRHHGALSPRRSAEAVDDVLGVEILPTRFRCRLGESPFRLHELVHEVPNRPSRVRCRIRSPCAAWPGAYGPPGVPGDAHDREPDG